MIPKLSQGTYGRQDPPLGGRRGAGSVPRGSGARPAGRSSRHGAGSTCSEKESLAAGKTQPWLLSNLSTTGTASRALHPLLHQSTQELLRNAFQPHPAFPLSYTEPLLSPVPPREPLCIPALGPLLPLRCHPSSFNCLSLPLQGCLASPKTCCCCTCELKPSLRARGPIPSRRCAQSGFPPCCPPALGRMQEGAFREQQACLERPESGIL